MKLVRPKLKRPSPPPSVSPRKRVGKVREVPETAQVVGRYTSDPEYSDKTKSRARNAYRKSKKGFELSSCTRSLSYFEDMAEHLLVHHDGKSATAPVYKLTTVADLLQLSYQSLWRNVTAELIPSPMLVTHIGRRELPVYHREEVRALLTIIGEHKLRFAYYRKEHTETKERLYQAINEVRNKWENQLWRANQSGPARQPRPLRKRKRK